MTFYYQITIIVIVYHTLIHCFMLLNYFFVFFLTLKLEIASTLSTNNKITIHGIDLFSAFDSVNRVKMMEILNTICSEEDMKLIHVLLNDTILRVRTKEVGPTFDTNVGIPQGNGLS